MKNFEPYSDYATYIKRREKLVKAIKEKYPDKGGSVLLFAGFEDEHYKFRQESSFYYFSGLQEPGIVLSMGLNLDLNKSQILWVPKYKEARNKWSNSVVYGATKQTIDSWGVTGIQDLGPECPSYSISPYINSCNKNQYDYLIKAIKEHISLNKYIFTIYSDSKNYREQRLLLDYFITVIPEFKDYIIDISDIVARFRQAKSSQEIEKISQAVEVTINAYETASKVIEPNKFENEIQAVLEFIFTSFGARTAFPSIVASGKNSTVLHYTENSSTLKKGDLVVIDIGAEFDYYCADISRTFPVSGTFTARQKEIYNTVLDTQKYIESIAKPGYWIKNFNNPEKSLQHLAYQYLEKRGYAKYFTHGIGHYLGLDVHDVGNYAEPLKESDVITIEPGVYIPEESIGVRIEDNYLLTKNGNICLSKNLPKDPNSIEEMMIEPEDSEFNY